MGDLEHGTEFERWYRSAHRQVLAGLIAYAGDAGRAAEATDEAFSRVLRDWETVRTKRSPTAWTFTMARNLLRRQLRRTSRERELMIALAVDPNEVHRDHADGIVAALEVSTLLRVLTKKQRLVVILHHGFDLSQENVAELLGISRSTVATTLHDSRRILSEAMSGERPARRRSPAPEGRR
jgi:RNA polymerase sigma factor (sigma-70 family)